jgi:hypothetical protein
MVITVAAIRSDVGAAACPLAGVAADPANNSRERIAFAVNLKIAPP